MNKRLSYCGLVDSKIRASNKDLPVIVYPLQINYEVLQILTRHVELDSADVKAKFVQVLKVFFFFSTLTFFA